MQFATDFWSLCFEKLHGYSWVFTDESRFACGSDNHWVWRRSGDYRYSSLKNADKFPKFSVMVWGAIGIGFRSTLVTFDGHVDAKTYIESLKKGFFREVDEAYGGRPWVLVQDGATCHTTDANLVELSQHCHVCPSWPPNSPNLNPIEMLWGVIKARLNWNNICTREQAIYEITQAWKSKPLAAITKLCAGFPQRMEMMACARGETIQPLFSSNRTSVPLGYLPDRLHVIPPAPWTPELDEFLFRVAREDPRHSVERLISLFPGRTVVSVKRR
jgi:hypothetical protein